MHQVPQVSLDLLDLLDSRDNKDQLAPLEEQDTLDNPVALVTRVPLDKLDQLVTLVLLEQRVLLEGLAVQARPDHLVHWDSQVQQVYRELRVLPVRRDLQVQQDQLDLRD